MVWVLGFHFSLQPTSGELFIISSPIFVVLEVIYCIGDFVLSFGSHINFSLGC